MRWPVQVPFPSLSDDQTPVNCVPSGLTCHVKFTRFRRIGPEATETLAARWPGRPRRLTIVGWGLNEYGPHGRPIFRDNDPFGTLITAK